MKPDKKDIVRQQLEGLLARKPLSEKLVAQIKDHLEWLQSNPCESDRIKRDDRTLRLFCAEYPEWPGIGKQTPDWPKDWKEPRWQHVVLEVLIGELTLSGYEDRRAMTNWRGSKRDRLCQLVDSGVPRRTVRRHLAVAVKTIGHILGARVQDPLGKVIEEFNRLDQDWPKDHTRQLVDRILREARGQKVKAPSAKWAAPKSCPYTSYVELRSALIQMVQEHTKGLPVNSRLIVERGLDRSIGIFEARKLPVGVAYTRVKNTIKARVRKIQACPVELQGVSIEDALCKACDLLGVERLPDGGFSLDVARKAYLKASFESHPDRQSEETRAEHTQEFIAVNRAWDTLKGAQDYHR